MSRKIFDEGAKSRYDELLTEFKNLAINRFTWKNLPYGLTSEKMEEMLIEHGQLMFYKRSEGGFYALPCFGENDLNVYGLPTKYRTLSKNGHIEDYVDISEGVLIKNNPLASDDLSTLEIFAKRIDDIEMTQEVNLVQQCTPKLILADEDSKLTAKNIMQKIIKFDFFIFAKKSLLNNISTSDVLDTSAPFVMDKLQQQKIDLKNELLTYLGINNNNNIKKERMIVDEVNANNDYVQIMLDLMFDMRKKACEEIKEMFDYNLYVEKREVQGIEVKEDE